MEAEVIWIRTSIIGIPFGTPDYNRIRFSDGTSFYLNSHESKIVCTDTRGEITETFLVESDDIGGFDNFSGRILLPSGALSCKRNWLGLYVYTHEKLGEISTEWMEIMQKKQEHQFEIYAKSNAGDGAILDVTLQKTILALELSIKHRSD